MLSGRLYLPISLLSNIVSLIELTLSIQYSQAESQKLTVFNLTLVMVIYEAGQLIEKNPIFFVTLLLKTTLTSDMSMSHL